MFDVYYVGGAGVPEQRPRVVHVCLLRLRGRGFNTGACRSAHIQTGEWNTPPLSVC